MKAFLLALLIPLQAFAAGKIINADIAPSGTANIARNKLAAGTNFAWCVNDGSGFEADTSVTASRAVATDANGVPVASVTTAAELGFVSGVTSSIQTQLNGKQSTVSFGAFGSTPNSSGGGISAGVITLQPADATNPGGVSTTTQTLAGAKTFSSTPTFSTMTVGSVLFAGTAGILSQDSSNFFYDSTNHDLLLNTTTQSGAATLVVKAKNSTTGGIALIANTGSEYWTLTPTANDLYLIDPNSNRRIFDALNTGQIAWGTANANGAANLDNFLVKNANGVGNTSTTFSVQKSTSQTGDLTDWYDTDGTTKLAKIDVTGKGFFANLWITGLTAGCLQTDGSGNVTANTCFSGTVTAVSVVTANGFAGSVATSTTTPAITLSTTINSPALAGNGTAISAATTTGSGSTVVLATAPTMTNPVVGTQAVGDNSTKAASTAFVQTQLAQLNPAAAVKAASTANIPGTYTNAVGGVCIADTFQVTATTAFAPDGVTLTVGQRFLMKDQTSGFQNGVWTLTTAANVGVLGALLTRALDWDSSADMNAGNLIPVISGTANANTVWYQTAAITTCNSDSQVYTQFSGGASGGDTVSVLTKTANYTVVTGDFSSSSKRLIVECNGSSPMTITLSALSSSGGYTITVKNIGAAECDVVPAGSDKIDGDTLLQLIPGGLPQSGDTIIGGSQWDIVS